MDMISYNSGKAMLTGLVRELHGPKLVPKDAWTVDRYKQISETPAERAAFRKKIDEIDKNLAKLREQSIQETGIDPWVAPSNFTIDRTPWTEGQMAAYVQNEMDKFVENDAKTQRSRAWFALHEAGNLAMPENPVIDTTA
ncbi:DUF3352 domain-containing protein [Quatrionicoccus australiensis]|uniref:DUF3352 domain-containing protein n=1 Tax=Quatrionicoccus australiensis TaxID=138118 RepID=UPI001CF9D474|nr:DUF3352 domain-containing protein [Quatrionicoccus australiensis]MCB4358223.1 hypothetical protein [Quatrionicoccus australiensis]